VTQRREPPLDRWRQFAHRGLDPGRGMDMLDGRNRRHACVRAPGQEFIRRTVIGAPGVRVADVGREEFEET